MMQKHPLESDFRHIVTHCSSVWPALKGASIFITGGTGFFGRWLVESLLYADTELSLGLHLSVLARHASQMRSEWAHDPRLTLIDGDVCSFDFPSGAYSHVIHAATPASAKLEKENPDLMYSINVQGTERVLEFARTRDIRNVLFTSSGAVYGRQPEAVMGSAEDDDWSQDADQVLSAYARGKRTAEAMCKKAAQDNRMRVTIARCFAFVGPYLPLDTHFAIGNFILDGSAGRTICVKGDGTPFRSYLYASDLVIWLLSILVHGQSARPYNVGSGESINIATLAHTVGRLMNVPVEILGKHVPGTRIERYVPNVLRAQEELGLLQRVSLDEAILKTAAMIPSSLKN